MTRRDEGPRQGPTLRAYFIALGIACLAAAASGVAYVSVQSAHDGREQAAQDAAHAVRLTSKQVGDGVALLQATVAQLAKTPNIADVFSKPEDCALSFGGPAGIEAGHIDVMDRSGQVVCSSRPPAEGQPLPDHQGAAWLGKAATGPTLAAPVADAATGLHAVVSAAPFDGGVVAGFLTLEPAGRELASLFGGTRPAEVLVVSAAEGRIITRSGKPERWIGQLLPADQRPVGSGLGATPDLDGVPRIYRSAPIAGTDWRLWVGVDEAAALADAHTLRDRQLVIIGAGLLVLLGVIAVVYRRIARPIAHLSERVGASTAASPAHIPVEGPREIAELAESVNAMTASLQAELARRQEAEARARAAAANYRELFERSPLPMWIHDRGTGQMLAANGAALRTYGYSEADFLALGVDAIQASTTEHRRYDGSALEVRTVAHDVGFAGHDARLVIAEDVGERERLEQRIQQGQRMEAIGRVAGGIAHDFNNLLAAIVGYSDLLLHQLDADDEDVIAEVREIKSAGERGVGLTRQLLSFARGQESNPEVLDLNAVVRGLEPLLRQLVPPNVVIETDLSPDAGAIEADRGQLDQVLTNLAVNAGHAMPGGGRLRLATGSVAAPDAGGQLTTLEISDTGVGMDESTRSHIFEPFFTTREPGEGTGLGLATVYRIVEQTGGRIDVASEVGAGTTFTISLPTADESPEAAAPAAQGREPEQRPRRVLLVDDDDAVRTVVRRMLELHGFELLEAADGDQALTLSEGQPAGDLDLIVTDSVVPGPGGLDLARRVQLRHPGIRVLIMSGYGEQDALGDPPATDAGYIGKPFTRDELEARLAALDDGD